MKPASEIDELKQLDRYFKELTDKLAGKCGSIFRIAHQYLANWGMDYLKNKEWIDAAAKQHYYKEWRKGTDRANEAIELAIGDIKLDMGNISMNNQLAELAVKILFNMYNKGKRTFNIYDVGAGAGDTTIAMLDAMSRFENTRRLVPHCYFHLVEPSGLRLMKARWAIEGPTREERILFGEKTSFNGPHELYEKMFDIPEYVQNSHLHLYGLEPGSIDMIVSNAAFHHIPFPDHFAVIAEKLKEDGVVVLGDWHFTVFKHPAFFVDIMKSLGADDDMVKDFRRRFRVNEGDEERQRANLTERERKADDIKIQYIPAEARRLTSVGEELFFFEAYESIADRAANMGSGGLVTDMEALRRHPGFKGVANNVNPVFTTHDSAAIIAAANLPKHLRRNRATKGERNQRRRAFA